MTGVDDLLRRRPPRPAPTLSGGKVTKVTTDGAVYVTIDGGDERHPIGPCRGAHHRPPAETTCPAGEHTHPVPPLVPLPRGTRVLVATTDTGPWIISWEETP